MRRQLAWIAAGALLFCAAAAQASDATSLADKAGFLVGHAYRCGVDQARLERSATLVGRLISALSEDDGDKEAAREEFTERLLAGAFADKFADQTPSCAAVRAAVAEFVRHDLAASPAADRQGGQMARDNPPRRPAPSKTAAAKPAKSAKSGKAASTRREDLTLEERTALEMRRIARETRGKPPSI